MVDKSKQASSTEPKGGFAFPVQMHGPHPTILGMSLRDYFAGQALAGLLADPNNVGHRGQNAESSYEFADAMIAERDK